MIAPSPSTHRFGGRVVGFLLHAAALAVGFVMMVVGLALGVTMVMLPAGVVIGMAGFLLFLGGLFARIDRDA